MEREVNVKKVVVIGTGTMAAGIGAGFINAGFACVFLGRQIGKARQSLAAAHASAQGLTARATPEAVAGSAGSMES